MGPEISKWTLNSAELWMKEDGFAAAIKFICGITPVPTSVELPALPYQFAGTFLVLSIIPVLLIFVVRRVGFQEIQEKKLGEPARQLSKIICQPVFIVAVLCAVVGWGTMVLMMTATPIAMKVEYGHNEIDAMSIVQWHMVGMFAPSFITGTLIVRYGLLNILLVGLILSACSSFVGLMGGTMAHFWMSNVLVGMGWNFLFVGGTALLTYAYRASERSRTQGVNDFMVFGAVALFSGTAGWIHSALGWETVCYIVIPFIVTVFFAVLWLKLAVGSSPEGLCRKSIGVD